MRRSLARERFRQFPRPLHLEIPLDDSLTSGTPRRGFLGQVAAAAVGVGSAALLPITAHAASLAPTAADPALEAWFAKLAGKHRTVFDASEPNEGMPGIWPRIYVNTTEATYPGEKTVAMVILRHGGLALGFNDAVWAKYGMGEAFKIMEAGKPAVRNPYATIVRPGVPGLGIAELLKAGVLIGACEVALTVYSSAAAARMKLDPAVVKQEWMDGLLPGIQVVPSGVFAVARAQELGASYIFAG